MVYFLLFIFGLVIGSFLNVVSLRYRPEQKLFDRRVIGGRSCCQACRRILAWYELIPLVSFLVLRGQCRTCGHTLSFQYPVVELLSGLIVALVPLKIFSLSFSASVSVESALVSVVWVVVFELLLLLSIIDFRHYIIPDQINIALTVFGLVFVLSSSLLSLPFPLSTSFLGHYALLWNFFDSLWREHLFAAFIAALFFAAVILVTRGRAMGWGDVKLIAPLGLLFGWPDIVMIMGLSFVVGSLFVLPLLFRHKKTMNDVVPFGPFIVMAAALVFFFGFDIIDSYFTLFNLY